MSATEAYVAAGYSDILSGPSAYRMLNHPSVAARIAELKAAAAKAALITPARVLDETGKIAFGSITDNDNDPKWLSWLTKDQAGVLGQKRAALADIGKYLGMSKEKVEHSGPGGGPIAIDVLLDVLLTPANLERLSDIEVESIRSAAAKLALPPAASGESVVNGEFVEVLPGESGERR